MEATAATRADFAAQLADLGFLPPSYARACAEGARALPADAAAFDDASGNARIVKAALCAGFYPSILRVEHPAAVFAETHGGALEKDADPARLKFFDRRRGVLPPAPWPCDTWAACVLKVPCLRAVAGKLAASFIGAELTSSVVYCLASRLVWALHCL